MLGDTDEIISCKQDLHEALDRNGYFMPNFKNRCVTIEYLMKVKKGAYWVPKYENIRLASCYRKPSKDVAFVELVKITR